MGQLLGQRGVHPSRCVVLVPYAQLMQQAKSAWATGSAGASFMPRFETTHNWATSLQAARGPATPGVDDIRHDMACDWLAACRWLARAGLGAHQDVLAGALVEAAWSVARVAAAVAPERRADWGRRLSQELTEGLDSSLLVFEAAVSQLALAWAAASRYPTDILFEAQADLLIVLDGFQADPLAEALAARFGEQCVRLPLAGPAQPRGDVLLQSAADGQEEADRAAACVLAHLAQGRAPIALIAQDRVLTRRIRALLDEQGVVLRDETGWKLSTTRAAASVMALLRALSWDASTDQVLAWLKNAPGVPAQTLTAAEAALRRAGVRQWAQRPSSLEPVAALAAQVQPWIDSLQKSRPLSTWLRDLRQVLRHSGQWDALVTDVAGQSLLDGTRLQDGQEVEFENVSERMSLRDFTGWVSQTVEEAGFSPVHPPQAQVVILPLSQLLGRCVNAVVLPGADEIRLQASPEPPGPWTPAQRLLLGLPTREELAASAQAAWDYALQFSRLDILWRTADAGERIMPSSLVQALQLQQTQTVKAEDSRAARSLSPAPMPRPAPNGQALPVTRLSASAYEDLRRCPYRFFAMRQLQLQEADELDGELGKRDFGNWLHAVLRHFHEALQAQPTSVEAEPLALIDAAAERATKEQGLSDSEFLPFAAAWPRVREGYLAWLQDHEAEGAQFVHAEAWREVGLGPVTLIGKIDRIDRQADGQALVIDYKTEARTVTSDRVKSPQEDTQLAFYAALVEDDTLTAAYVNLGEKEPTRTYAQEDIVTLREQLMESILSDVSRIAEGAPLPALGEGQACAYCAARGLCRKDFRMDSNSAEVAA